MPLEFWVSFSFMFVSLRIVSPVSVMSDRTLTLNIGFVLDLFEKKMRKKNVSSAYPIQFKIFRGQALAVVILS